MWPCSCRSTSLVPLVDSFCRRLGAPVVCIVATILSAAAALFLKAAFTDAGLALNVANVFQRIPSFFTGYLLADRLISGKSRGGGICQSRCTWERSRIARLVSL